MFQNLSPRISRFCKALSHEKDARSARFHATAGKIAQQVGLTGVQPRR